MTFEKPKPTDQSDFWVIGDLVDETGVPIPDATPPMPRSAYLTLRLLLFAGALLTVLIVFAAEATGLTEDLPAIGFCAVVNLFVYSLAYMMLRRAFPGWFEPPANRSTDGQSARTESRCTRSRP